jgi:hypothetical protein
MSKSLVAKAVFGEITLGEVLKKFHKKISAIIVEYEDNENTYDNWCVDDGDCGQELQLMDDYEVTSFPLETKVKLRSGELEIEHEVGTFILTFMEHKKVKFDSLLPKKS